MAEEARPIYEPFLDYLASTALQPQLYEIKEQVARSEIQRHGQVPHWAAAVAQMPPLHPSQIDLVDQVKVGTAADGSPEEIAHLEQQLQLLHPWRKGPFSLFDILIDTEWRSDWKWERIRPALHPLQGRTVLDIGCGSGYHIWRMVGAGARTVVGLEPMWLYLFQFEALKRYIQQHNAGVLPLRFEQMPADLKSFDTVFSMGVLYHARSPFDHLLKLHDALRPGGQLILETLVIDGGPGQILVPEGRYAQMRNVWFLPTPLTLESWLRKCGFNQIELIDVNVTTPKEQRSTPWMRFHSLQNFLNPDDPTRTVEGYPAPTRAAFSAIKP
ncbi:MAG: tRNA 5-methoxyuridine(34)/uridine 5-oxyacetic acid(34) synthase CmoB [Ardenticatenaceae bacterium]|nr:tRNA 5-methoxyuridine(34)/uridine 5-oxyacetic acid(34) synthase CmoB [Ardenticatenaceae bacterium]